MLEYISILLTTLLGLVALFLKKEKDDEKQSLWKNVSVVGWGVGLIILVSTGISFYALMQKKEQSKKDSAIKHLEYEKQMSALKAVIDNQKIQLLEQNISFQEQKYNDSIQSLLIKSESDVLSEKLNISQLKLKNLERRLYPIEDLSFFFEIRFKPTKAEFHDTYREVKTSNLNSSLLNWDNGHVIPWQDSLRSQIVTDKILSNDLWYHVRAYEDENKSENEWLFYKDGKVKTKQFIVWIDSESQEFILKAIVQLPERGFLLSPRLIGLKDLTDKYLTLELFAYKSNSDINIKLFELKSKSGFSFKNTEFTVRKETGNNMKTFGTRLIEGIAR